MPLPYRWLTSLMVRYNGHSILIDCGEGTQIALKEKGWSPNPIDMICFTHYHADHISGLPGMLLTMGNAERRELQVQAFRVNHNVVCYGYSISLGRAGRFQVEKAREMGIEMRYWSRLQKGERIETEKGVLTPEMVLGPARKGLKLTYCTDTRPTESIVEHAAGSDLFICEGMYGEADKLEKAKDHKHMTFQEAAKLAKKADVGQMWLTHYSPSLTRPEPFMDDVRKIFPRSYAGKDGKSIELQFEDGEL